MKLKVLGSSSKGNCYILETPTGSLLLDAGVPFRKIQAALCFDLSGIQGCLVTHEHNDHCKAVNDLLKAGIDVYTSKGTIEAIEEHHHRLGVVLPGFQFQIEDFYIVAFETQHDAAEPLGYLIQYKPTGEKLLFATDTYYLRYRFGGVNYILIESNYIKDILDANIESGSVPQALAKRLLESHFSLDHVKGFMQANDLSEVRKIVLIHLSDGNSDAARMVREIHELTGKDVVVADAGEEIPLELYPF